MNGRLARVALSRARAGAEREEGDMFKAGHGWRREGGDGM